jgi:hypothetical protein
VGQRIAKGSVLGYWNRSNLKRMEVTKNGAPMYLSGQYLKHGENILWENGCRIHGVSLALCPYTARLRLSGWRHFLKFRAVFC